MPERDSIHDRTIPSSPPCSSEGWEPACKHPGPQGHPAVARARVPSVGGEGAQPWSSGAGRWAAAAAWRNARTAPMPASPWIRQALDTAGFFRMDAALADRRAPWAGLLPRPVAGGFILFLPLPLEFQSLAKGTGFLIVARAAHPFLPEGELRRGMVFKGRELPAMQDAAQLVFSLLADLAAAGLESMRLLVPPLAEDARRLRRGPVSRLPTRQIADPFSLLAFGEWALRGRRTRVHAAFMARARELHGALRLAAAPGLPPLDGLSP